MLDTVDIQKRCRRWVETRLGMAAMEPHERAMRMLEEACELAQSLGVNREEAQKLLHVVYSKPPGDVRQELGGAALTLLACADACGELLGECAKREMERVESLPPDKFRKRQLVNAADGIGALPSGNDPVMLN